MTLRTRFSLALAFGVLATLPAQAMDANRAHSLIRDASTVVACVNVGTLPPTALDVRAVDRLLDALPASISNSNQVVLSPAEYRAMGLVVAKRGKDACVDAMRHVLGQAG